MEIEIVPDCFRPHISDKKPFTIKASLLSACLQGECFSALNKNDELQAIIDKLSRDLESNNDPTIEITLKHLHKLQSKPKIGTQISKIARKNSDQVRKPIDISTEVKRRLPTELDRGCIQVARSNVQYSKEMHSIKRLIKPTHGRYGLFKSPHLGMNEAKRLLSASIPESMLAWESIGEGDCFFDSIAIALDALDIDHKQSVKSLRVICSKFARALDRQCQGNPKHKDNWVSQGLKHHYHQYLANIEYTVQERASGKGLGNDGLAIWGEQHIDGKILCSELNITIHMIEIQPNPAFDDEGGERFFLAHNVISAQNMRSVDQDDIDYNAERTVHLVGYRNHFVPLLPKECVALNAQQREHYQAQTEERQFSQFASSSLWQDSFKAITSGSLARSILTMPYEGESTMVNRLT